jgi:hypothetical protein
MPTAIENYNKSIEELMKQSPNLPCFVYKYCRFDEYTFSNLNEKKLWVSHPNKYNDPFDSKIIPLESYTRDDIREYLNCRKRLRINKPEETADEIEYTIEQDKWYS